MSSILLDEVDADTNGSDHRYEGGLATVIVTGADFGGGTAKLQIKQHQGTYVDIPDMSFTANGVKNLLLGGGALIRAVLTGATNPSNVSVSLTGRV